MADSWISITMWSMIQAGRVGVSSATAPRRADISTRVQAIATECANTLVHLLEELENGIVIKPRISLRHYFGGSFEDWKSTK